MRSTMIIVILSLGVAWMFGNPAMSKEEPVKGEAKAADPVAQRYFGEMEAAGAAYAKVSEAIRTESEERYAVAKAEYDTAAQRARDTYVKALEAELNQQKKAGNQAAADAVQTKIDQTLNGPPMTAVQKLWVASYTAEQAKDYEEALAAVQKVIQATGSAKNTFTQTRLGWLYLLNGQHEQSEAAYKTAAALAPKSITPRQGLVSCYLAAKRTDDAINAAREVLKLDPQNYQANRTIGDLLYAKEDYARAGAYYQRLTTAHADDLAAATSLGWCYLKLNQKPLALQIFNDVLAVQPDNVMAGSGYAAASEKHAEAATKESADTKTGTIATDKIVLRNPKGVARTVNYTLNGQHPVTLQPGQDQTLDAKRAWTIRFNQAGANGQVQVRLQPGVYEFDTDGNRWKLSRRVRLRVSRKCCPNVPRDPQCPGEFNHDRHRNGRPCP